jgi:hypothetical protein
MHRTRHIRPRHAGTSSHARRQWHLAKAVVFAAVAAAGLYVAVPTLIHGAETFGGMICSCVWVFGSIGAIGRLAWHVRRLTRRSRVLDRVTHGRCPRCDYDLTNLTSRRCPECGSYARPLHLSFARTHQDDTPRRPH